MLESYFGSPEPYVSPALKLYVIPSRMLSCKLESFSLFGT